MKGGVRELQRAERSPASPLPPPHTNTGPTPPPQVEDGVRELQRAERTQKGGRAMKCIVVLCVLIAIFLLITIVRHA